MENNTDHKAQEAVLDKSTVHDETVHSAAERGHVATDSFGRSLLVFDKAAESRLRLKIDLYIIPTVT